ncbi:MAG: Fic family protein [Thermodesulfobacteriota bacterium]
MDKKLVSKIMTFKSGNFAFSRVYDKVAVEKLLIEAKTLREAVEDMPILPKWASQLEEEVIRRSIYSTAALEGNPLSEQQVGAIIEADRAGQFTARAEREISNLKLAYQACRLLAIPKGAFLLSEKLIQSMHKTITAGIEHATNVPGSYREHSVKVGNSEHGGTYTPPKIRADIEKLMREFVVWLNSPEALAEEPLVRAGLAHFHLGAIHPFADGNGRTARLMEAVILRADGIKHAPEMLSKYYYNHMDDYYWAFTRSERNKENDLTPFLTFVLNAFLVSLREIKQKIGYIIRRLALRDYIAYLRGQKAITMRQYDLLGILVEYFQPFTLNDLFTSPHFVALYREVSDRTARRDIKKLLDLRLLLETEKGKYSTNFNVLNKA